MLQNLLTAVDALSPTQPAPATFGGKPIKTILRALDSQNTYTAQPAPVVEAREEVECNESNIRLVNYNPTSQLMRVEYTNGAQYDYQDVSADVWFECKNAYSKGRFLAERVKGNYRYYRVNGD